MSSEEIAQSVRTGEYTDWISAEEKDAPPTSVQDETVNNLILRFQ